MHRYFLIPVLGFFAFICIFAIYLQFINDDWKFSDYKYNYDELETLKTKYIPTQKIKIRSRIIISFSTL